MPVAFVFTGKTAAQREGRMRRLEQAARAYFAGASYPGRGAGITAVDYHQLVSAVVTELERITADPAGAAGAVWRRLGRDEWQTLPEGLDNPDGDRLYATQRMEARDRRPVCTRCGAKFTDERWQQVRQSSWPGKWDDLCEPCAKESVARAEAERVAQRQAEDVAAGTAAEAETSRAWGLFRRRGQPRGPGKVWASRPGRRLAHPGRDALRWAGSAGHLGCGWWRRTWCEVSRRARRSYGATCAARAGLFAHAERRAAWRWESAWATPRLPRSRAAAERVAPEGG